MGWFSDFVSDPIGTTVDTVSSAVNSTVNAVTNHPLETAAAATAAYFTGGTSLAMEGATAEAGAAALAPVVDSSAPILVADIAPYAGASSNAAFDAALGTATSSTAGLSAGQILATTSAGLNLATSGIKLAALGKTMNASTPTVDGLTGGLAASPIQTPAGLITTTPQGPVTSGPASATTGGFMGMDTQTLIVIAVAMGGIWYLMKHGK